jgi:pimeloyl-ACP methyl ester carboxylesterase
MENRRQMLDSHVRGAYVYRSEPGAQAVRLWCERQVDGWEDLVALPEVDSSLGTTRAFRAPGGSGTPVALLNGPNFKTAPSVDVLRRLAEDRPVISVDVPGQPGLSSGVRPRAPRDAAYGAWLDEVLPHVTDDPVIVLGHSLGAAIALASRPSPLVKALVLLDPARFIDTATYDDPKRVPEGISRVFVAGRTVWADGAPTGVLLGNVLREPLPGR